MNSHRIITACAMALVVVLSGCANTNISQDAKFDKSSQDGLVVGSISHPNTSQSYSVSYSGLDNHRKGSVHSRKAIAGTAPGRTVDDLFALKLPAGEYEFNSWLVTEGRRHIKPEEKFSIKFSVQPGIARYLGSFDFEQISDYGLDSAKFNVIYSDQYARDSKDFKQRYKSVDLQDIVRGIEPGTEVDRLGGATTTELASSLIVFSSF